MTEPERTRTPEQAAAWSKVEEERRNAGPRPPAGPGAAALARVVIGVLVVAAALTAYFAMSPDVPDDRTDVLLLVGLVGGGAALAASALPRD
ncbi:hypothetical protein EUA93_02035 [Nocardioides oleivorans]|uniref:Uncharacterized protein n=1 Tax=Nocardioides oleivorans TaxID=273676 RepID=A0A4Q2RWB3_9ACTN|nr:hypothetical protein [Nocardioides oleivorans]RYB93238.1 hypothetical protein EUA93_02035 [Nocardioides oleivorans]